MNKSILVALVTENQYLLRSFMNLVSGYIIVHVYLRNFYKLHLKTPSMDFSLGPVVGRICGDN